VTSAAFLFIMSAVKKRHVDLLLKIRQ